MVDLFTGLRLLGGLVLLFGNGYFVTIEFAMTRVRQFSQDQFQGGGLERAWQMTERLEIFLSGCQVGITVCSVGLGVVAEPAVAALFNAMIVAAGLGSAGGAGHTTLSVVLALALINLLHVILGEQAPTYLGIERTRFVAKYGAPILYWWTRLMWPVIVLADWVAKGLLGLFGVEITRSWTEEEREEEEAPTSRGELRRQTGEILSQAGLSQERREEVLNALHIGDIPVEDVMVDREEVVFLSTAMDVDENLRRIRESPHVRYPLVGEDVDEFVGVVYTPMVVEVIDKLEAGEVTLEEIAAPPMTVSATAPVSDVIDRFQAENQELALVLRDGEVVGLVTSTDCFEAMVGELEDPTDQKLVDSS